MVGADCPEVAKEGAVVGAPVWVAAFGASGEVLALVGAGLAVHSALAPALVAEAGLVQVALGAAMSVLDAAPVDRALVACWPLLLFVVFPSQPSPFPFPFLCQQLMWQAEGFATRSSLVAKLCVVFPFLGQVQCFLHPLWCQLWW